MGLSKLAKALRQRRQDERGAELIEFAFVVVLLVTLVYGIAVFGLIFGTNETVTQAAADASRSGMVYSTAIYGVEQAQNTALSDMSWLIGSGVTCSNGTTSSSSAVACQMSTTSTCATTYTLCINAYQTAAGGTNNYPTSGDTNTTGQTTFTTVVTYNYQQHPLLYNAPGLNVVVPKALVSTATYQVTATAS